MDVHRKGKKGSGGKKYVCPKYSYVPFCASEVLDQFLRRDNSIVYNFYLKNGSGSVYIGSVFLI
ncbi:XXYS1_4_G0036550.mRNA.1.CDS.1 [Saccharomyces cerevisiae]|nr:EM14S01-3B_G0033960.mRNA.1.CDS.1 [Saccharomyces cerevisiae]CAD6626492.1 XXYS1_4_G0036550.mRNA.1.CDS.1 [Saccharomyces cerevisiae]CAI4484348.1 AMH_1a_G0020990.mRNA.1.CDS.1 [Saccharomyces cerevisiae]CAI4495626.1 CEI_1a_G0020910.mRNA.1.CDS.1 [Saccharomyces cerevisiae]CAI6680088.1 AMH_1a_G0020990.mRNA.1.CDS.1 [Saccharomyces cerevisiae]